MASMMILQFKRKVSVIYTEDSIPNITINCGKNVVDRFDVPYLTIEQLSAFSYKVESITNKWYLPKKAMFKELEKVRSMPIY